MSGGPGAPHCESRLLQAVVGDTEAWRCESTYRTYKRGEQRECEPAEWCGPILRNLPVEEPAVPTPKAPRLLPPAGAGSRGWRVSRTVEMGAQPLLCPHLPHAPVFLHLPQTCSSLHPLPASTAWRTPGAPEKGGAPQPSLPHTPRQAGPSKNAGGRRSETSIRHSLKTNGHFQPCGLRHLPPEWRHLRATGPVCCTGESRKHDDCEPRQAVWLRGQN